MSSEWAIVAENIDKAYTIYNKPSDRLFDLFSQGQVRGKQIHALDDVSIKIPKGKTIGLIGQNGSGKSTLLQIIAGTLQPTGGNVTVNGKIAALLELGSGFNPDFAGRDNVMMNGALMGLTKEEILQRMDSIEAFADIGEFIDQPVKTYSSGMFLRLAFAAAVHTDPDILIVDEALAVGDARFQNKCFRKFKEFQEAGKTIIFVSHTTELLVRHCDYAYLLNKGKLVQEGNPKEVVNEYLDLLFGKSESGIQEKKMVAIDSIESKPSLDDSVNKVATFIESRPNEDSCVTRKSYNPQEYRWGTQDATIMDYLVISDQRVDQIEYNSDHLMTIYFKVKFNKKVLCPIYGLTIKTMDGVVVYGSNSRDINGKYKVKDSTEWSILKFEFVPKLIQGDYFVSLGVAEDIPGEEAVPLDRRYDLIHLKFFHNSLGFGITDLEMTVDELG